MSDKKTLVKPEDALEVRCIDARAYARKLKREGYGHTFIISKIGDIWDSDVVDHIESTKDNGYYKLRLPGGNND